MPLSIVALIILEFGRWPEMWLIHWIVPLFKRGAMGDAKNYRGVHLTAQLSKVMEKLLRPLLEPFLVNHDGFGHNQFTYMEGRWARDALAFDDIKKDRSVNETEESCCLLFRRCRCV